MRAMVLHRFRQPLRLVTRRRPVPRGEQVLVRVLAVGVCHSDVHIVDGAFGGIRLPLVLGHKVAGEAPELGPVLVYAACRSGGPWRNCVRSSTWPRGES